MRDKGEIIVNILLDSSFISGSPSSYQRIAKIHMELKNAKDSEIINIKVDIEKRIGLPLLFYISTLPFIAEKYNKSVKIFCNDKMISLFKRAGYIDKNTNNIYITTNITDILKGTAKIIKEKEDIFNIVTDITSEAPVQMSEKLSEIFISKVGEMFNNADEHSDAEYIIGAKYFKNQKYKYCFSCYDTGIGIPSKVKLFKNFDSDIKALEWAMKRGNTTANRDSLIPRGLGLGLLHSFAKANDGTIRICSGKALYVYNKSKGERYYPLEYNFEGTLFEMDIIADNDHRYIIE